MAISITAAEVKRKAMVSVSDYDASIASLIAEMQPALEYSIADSYLSDTTNTNLQATLKLGILEMITGEFIEQLRREIGASEEFSAGGVSVSASALRGVDIIQQGATRLAPYLKTSLPAESDAMPSSTTADRETVFSRTEEVW
ncbi:MAG: hypothetical protein ABFD54_04980 [Armatimonadota bacterium]|nr:hypothetical protein [bacterium]